MPNGSSPRQRRLPYGRGEATIVDTDVRRVWQIEPSQFVLRNAEWNTHVAAIVDAVKQEFGIRQKVNPRLYKLLVYEKGSFFAPHRDTEKTSGHVRHVGRLPAVPPRRGNPDRQTRRPNEDDRLRRQGLRIQNAVRRFLRRLPARNHAGDRGISGLPRLQSRDRRKEAQPSAPQNAAAVEKAAQLLEELFADASSNLSKIAIPFKHQYTEAGLDPKQLKGSDRARADVLVRAAESLDYQCYLALLTHHQSGEADYDTLDFDPYRSAAFVSLVV